MKQNNFGGTGHGMPAHLSPDVEKKRELEEMKKRKKQTEDFAKNSLPSKGTTTTTIHESKNFPFQIAEVTITEDHKKEQKFFQIGVAGQIMSKTKFSTLENAESYISKRPWELITNLICLTVQNAIEYERTAKK